jgi:hypothetical protein
MYIKAVYRTVITMTPFYIENFCLWVKTAIWDAPRRIYLDVDLERQKIERDLSRVGERQSSSE